MKFFLIVLLFGLTLLNAEEYKQIGWSDLQGKIPDYDDPFKKLTKDQLFYLSVYARVKEMQKISPKRVNEGMLKDAKNAEEILKKEGIDIVYLLSQRDAIKKLRTEAASSVNTDLNNSNISMSGFMLSLEFNQGKTNKFLLVPVVGACVHTPPPPINQIIYVETKTPIDAGTRFTAVTINGKIITQKMSNDLFLVDGTDKISSGYIVQTDNVSKFKKK